MRVNFPSSASPLRNGTCDASSHRGESCSPLSRGSMDVACDGNGADISLCAVKKLQGTDDHVTAILPNGSVNHITEDQTTESSISCDVSTRITLTEDVSANESSCLLIHPATESALSEETAFPYPEAPADGVPVSQLPNGLPVCTAPSAVRPHMTPLQLSAHKPDTKRHHPASAASSPSSLKSSSRAVANDYTLRSLLQTGISNNSLTMDLNSTNRSQIYDPGHLPERCAQCILSCLFCEVLMACSLLVQCLDCGQVCEPLLHCCCTCEDADCGLCGVNACLDCRQCCESPNCLEVCMECCSICFSA